MSTICQNFIGGELLAANAAQFTPVFNPSRGELIAQAPDSVALRREAAEVDHTQAELARVQGDLAAALAAYRRWQALIDQLIAKQPDSIELTRNAIVAQILSAPRSPALTPAPAEAARPEAARPALAGGGVVAGMFDDVRCARAVTLARIAT